MTEPSRDQFVAEEFLSKKAPDRFGDLTNAKFLLELLHTADDAKEKIAREKKENLKHAQNLAARIRQGEEGLGDELQAIHEMLGNDSKQERLAKKILDTTQVLVAALAQLDPKGLALEGEAVSESKELERWHAKAILEFHVMAYEDPPEGIFACIGNKELRKNLTVLVKELGIHERFDARELDLQEKEYSFHLDTLEMNVELGVVQGQILKKLSNEL